MLHYLTEVCAFQKATFSKKQKCETNTETKKKYFKNIFFNV